MMVDHIAKDKTIIFSPYLNKEIELGLLKKYSNIFSDCELNEDLFECYEKNDFKDLTYIYSISKFTSKFNPFNF